MSLTASISRIALPTCLALSLIACGGGGGGGGDGGGGGGSGNSPPAPPAPPPVTNRPPVVAMSNDVQHAVQWHDINYDATRGGLVFSDPDGDPLRYELKLGHTYNPELDPDPPHGVRISGTQVVGTPETQDTIVVTITAIDPSGASVSNQFFIFVGPNGAPQANGEREDKLVQIGESFTLDATLGGTRFTDPEGDPLSYLVTLRGYSGVTVSGTQLTGRLSSVGGVEVTVTATDPFGASAQTFFVIAAPDATPGAPSMPATAFVYRDEDLPLPELYKTSSEFRIPLWDTQPIGNRTTDAGAALGRVLFHDKRLSITNTVACVSCHQREHGFASPQRFDTGVIGVPLTRNAMALANARYNTHNSWFSDVRAFSLQEVARQALTRADEMGNTLPAVEGKLRATPFYAPLFEAAFGSPEIDSDRILRALAQYVQALISYRTPYDASGCGAVGSLEADCDLGGLSAQENRGREIFFSNGDGHIPCWQCHSLPGGANIWLANNGLDTQFTDPGVDNGRFRPASLHNIALTAPYMHDGRFATLREVIDHYDHGIQESRDLDTFFRDTNQQVKRLNLSADDKDALEAFLHTLTDDVMLIDPKFSDPFE